jgi:hypothetical protein
MQQFNDRQERFEPETAWANLGVAVRIWTSLIGPISWYGERAGL